MSHARPKGRVCSHRRYRLDCDDYDALVAHAKGRCQVCSSRPDETKHGFLVVDHDATLGWWAVRGLLCSDCNSSLPLRVGDEAVRSYLDDPWYVHMLGSHGLSPDLPSEPGIGSRVQLLRGLVMRKEEDGWVRASGRSRPASFTWSGFHYHYGPRNIRLLVKADSKPASEES